MPIPLRTPSQKAAIEARDAFNPLSSSRFSTDVRRPGRPDLDDELRESMREFGWVEQFPAIADERGVVLVGHRRLAVAEELGIEPVVETVTLGRGDAADAQRFRIAIVSNLAAKPFTREERKDLAEYLYGEREWTMSRIAAALNVTHKTISKDLREFVPQVQTPRPGRPKGSTNSRRPYPTADRPGVAPVREPAEPVQVAVRVHEPPPAEPVQVAVRVHEPPPAEPRQVAVRVIEPAAVEPIPVPAVEDLLPSPTRGPGVAGETLVFDELVAQAEDEDEADSESPAPAPVEPPPADPVAELIEALDHVIALAADVDPTDHLTHPSLRGIRARIERLHARFWWEGVSVPGLGWTPVEDVLTAIQILQDSPPGEAVLTSLQEAGHPFASRPRHYDDDWLAEVGKKMAGERGRPRFIAGLQYVLDHRKLPAGPAAARGRRRTGSSR